MTATLEPVVQLNEFTIYNAPGAVDDDGQLVAVMFSQIESLILKDLDGTLKSHYEVDRAAVAVAFVDDLDVVLVDEGLSGDSLAEIDRAILRLQQVREILRFRYASEAPI
jgi:hypothetical protein